MESYSDSDSALAFDLLQELISASHIDVLSLATTRALPEIASAFRKRLQDGRNRIDCSWIEVSGPSRETGFLEGQVVSRSFNRNESEYYSQDVFDESVIHPLDTEAVKKSSGTIEQTSSLIGMLTGDSFFGAACLMAVAIEFETWNISDYSEDQVADLELGVLQPMAPLVIGRLLGESYLIPELRNELALGTDDAQILESWAYRRFSFTDMFGRRTEY